MDFKGDRKSDLLDTIGNILLENSGDIDLLVSSVFNRIISYYNIERGFVRIHHRDLENISVDIHHGYSADEVSGGIYKPGEGIIGTVLKTGSPYILLDVLNEPGFISKIAPGRYASANKISFICVPVKLGTRVIGTISVEIINNFGREVDDELWTLKVVSIIISQAINSRLEYTDRESLLRDEIRVLRNRLEIGGVESRLIGKSSAMRSVFSGIIAAAESDADVVISGKSGTGRGLVAEQIQSGSRRSGKPFIRFNAATYSPSAVEAVLFGVEDGRKNGHDDDIKGVLELSREGTLLVENMEALSETNQLRLINAIHETRSGSGNGSYARIFVVTEDTPVAADMRLIDALSCCGEAVSIHLPELRERKSDILLIANHFLEQYSRKMDKYVKRISPGAVDLLTAYHWPGNVRELQDCIEKGVEVCEEGVIRGYHLPLHLQASEDGDNGGTLEERTEMFEREIITDALKISGGNITVAAKRLGSTKRILGYKIDKLGIDYRAFRNSDK